MEPFVKYHLTKGAMSQTKSVATWVIGVANNWSNMILSKQ